MNTLKNLLKHKTPATSCLTNISESAKSHHDKIKEKLKRELEPIEHIALTSDGWTSRQNYSYLGVTCHYLNHPFYYHPFYYIISYIHFCYEIFTLTLFFSTICRIM
jgi:hypothetical protein